MKNLPLILTAAVSCALTHFAHAGGFYDFSVSSIRSSADFHTNSSESGTPFASAIAKNIASGDNMQTRKVDFAHQLAIELRYRAPGTAAQNIHAKIEYYFLARGLQTNLRYLFDRGSQQVTSGDFVYDAVSVPVQEQRIQQTRTSYSPNNSQYGGAYNVSVSSSATKSGSKIEGWVAILRDGTGKVLQVEASLFELKDLVERNPAALENLPTSATGAAPYSSQHPGVIPARTPAGPSIGIGVR